MVAGLDGKPRARRDFAIGAERKRARLTAEATDSLHTEMSRNFGASSTGSGNDFDDIMEAHARLHDVARDFTDDEYEVLVRVINKISRSNSGLGESDLSESASAFRASLSIRRGSSQQQSEVRGTFHPILPDVGALQRSGLVAETREFKRDRYKRSSDPNVETVRRHWFRFIFDEAKTSPIRPHPGHSFDAVSIEEDLWSTFASYLARRVSGNTTGQYISLLRRWHRNVTGYDPTAAAMLDCKSISQTIAGIRSDLPSKKRQRFAHPTRISKAWRARLNKPTSCGVVADIAPVDYSKAPWQNQLNAARLLRAMVIDECGVSSKDLKYFITSAVMTAALMRISEACPSRSSGNYVITRKDVKFVWSAEGHLLAAELWMLPLKKGPGADKVRVVLKHTPSGSVQAAWWLWLLFVIDPVKVEDFEKTALFRNFSWEADGGRIISQTQFRTWYHQQMKDAGFAAWQAYNLHSFRIGGATALLAKRCPLELIKAMGRWASDVAEIYARPTRDILLSLSEQLDTADTAPFEDAADEEIDHLAGVSPGFEDEADRLAEELTQELETEDEGD